MKYSPLFSILLCLLPFYGFAQVGINTTTPHPSSILDITSTDKGMLSPRLTSAQRLAIVSPAEGLLVFDTDEAAFVYYNGSEWQKVGSTLLRDNYKLVKSVDDLSDELAAGGGTSYLLNTDFLYEINGSISIDFPIDLNGAYIEGVDTGQDVLINISGGALFQGSNGGSIRNITLSGNGNPILNISGSGGEFLIVNNTFFVNASNVGSVTGINTLFLSITQYVNNDDGLTLSDMNTLFMSNMLWTQSNTGTFVTATGTFENFQMANGRVETDSGEVGLDVSNNPIINNEGVLNGVSFVGNGTRVQPYTANTYTGFNFTTSWSINSPGVPTETDEAASANFFENSTLTTGLTQAIIDGNPVEIEGNGVFLSTDLFRYRAEGGGNRLVYEGLRDRNVQVNASLSIRVVNAPGDFYTFVLAKNSTVVTETNSVIQITNDTQIQNVALNGILSMSNEDFIEIFVQRLTGIGTDTLVVFSENLSVR